LVAGLEAGESRYLPAGAAAIRVLIAEDHVLGAGAQGVFDDLMPGLGAVDLLIGAVGVVNAWAFPEARMSAVAAS
jgi:hypothetical protein